jgi:hypothetical protein
MHKINDSIIRSGLASKIAYADNCTIANKLYTSIRLQGRNPTCKILDNNNTHVYSWQCGVNSKLIAFRGSNNIKEAAQYLNSDMTELHIRNSKFKIHTNIFNMFHNLENELTNYILSPPLSNIKQTITFCGHSKGAACAMLAAAYYGDITGDNFEIKCHTFACPKLGDKNFITWYLNNVDETFNILTEHDFVQYIPCWSDYVDNPNVILLHDNCNPLIAHDLDTYNDLMINKISDK